jgi:SAM-dependent methyltransferase
MSEIDGSPRARRIIQTVCDLRRSQLKHSRIVDLGCAHGQFALDFAARGATTVGIEGRASWLQHAEAARSSRSLKSATFVQDDARNFKKAKYGTFDVVLCLGLFYHLNVPDIFDLLVNMHDACSDFIVIDSQISMKAAVSTRWRGQTFWGWEYQEHAADSTPEKRMAEVGASLDNEKSFWLTRYSLLNALRYVGFTSVMECQNPINNHFVDGEFKIYADYQTFVAFKGEPVGEFIGMNPANRPQVDWPENPYDYLMRPVLSLE